MHPNLLDQLQMLVTAVETGSFSATARRLGRAQNVVSYGISTLETTLDVRLFDRSGHKAVLTTAGHALLREARNLTSGAEGLLQKARELSSGLEPFLEIVLDELVSHRLIEPALTALHEKYSSLELRLIRTTTSAALKRAAEGRAALAVCCDTTGGEGPAVSALIGHVEMIPVVAADKIDALEFQKSVEGPVITGLRQIVLSSMEAPESSPDRGVFSAHIWRVQDLESKFQLLKTGLGWGMMPEHLVADALHGGELVRLELLQSSAKALIPVVLLERRDMPLGPAGQLFRRSIIDQ